MNLLKKAKSVDFIEDPTDTSISTAHEHSKWLEVPK